VGNRSPPPPTPGAQVALRQFGSDEHPPGMPTSSLSFLPCETEPPNPNLSYLSISI